MEVSLIWEGQFIAATFTKNSDYLLCRLNSLNELCVAIGHFMYKGLKKIMFSRNLLNRIIKSRCQLLPLLCKFLYFMPITNFTNDLYFIFTINVQPKAWAYYDSNFLIMLYINKKSSTLHIEYINLLIPISLLMWLHSVRQFVFSKVIKIIFKLQVNSTKFLTIIDIFI